MSFLDFIINGGLCGFVEGFDYRKKGHPYNFDDLHRTLEGATKCVDGLSQIYQKLGNTGKGMGRDLLSSRFHPAYNEASSETKK